MVELIPLILIVSLLLPFFLVPLIVISGEIIHTYPIKIYDHLVLGTSPPVRSIFSNFVLGLIDTTRLNVLQSSKITLGRVHNYTVGEYTESLLIVGCG